MPKSDYPSIRELTIDQPDYVSIRELDRQGNIHYEEDSGRRVSDELWADEVYVSPSNVRFTVKERLYEAGGATGMNFHFFPNIPLTSVKGDIIPLEPRDQRRLVGVRNNNVLIFMNQSGDKRVQRLEVVVNVIGE